MTAASRTAKIDAALKAAADSRAYLADDAKTEIRICAGTACHASGPGGSAKGRGKVPGRSAVSPTRWP